MEFASPIIPLPGPNQGNTIIHITIGNEKSCGNAKSCSFQLHAYGGIPSCDGTPCPTNGTLFEWPLPWPWESAGTGTLPNLIDSNGKSIPITISITQSQN